MKLNLLRGRSLVAGAAAVALALATQVGAASALPARPAVGPTALTAPVRTASLTPSRPGARPTIVLVHGAWADPSSFAPQITALQRAGYTVLAAPNPVHALATDTKAVADFVEQRTSGPVVLVGHSYGGMVISGVHDPDVKALVYIDAYAPVAGESAAQLNSVRPGSGLDVPDLSTVLDFVRPRADAPEAEWDSYIKQSEFKRLFIASASRKEARRLAASQSPATLAALTAPFDGTPAWKTVPSWYVVGTADKVIPPAQQLAMAKRAGSHIVKIKAPHLAMLAKPTPIANTILQAARRVR